MTDSTEDDDILRLRIQALKSTKSKVDESSDNKKDLITDAAEKSSQNESTFSQTKSLINEELMLRESALKSLLQKRFKKTEQLIKKNISTLHDVKPSQEKKVASNTTKFQKSRKIEPSVAKPIKLKRSFNKSPIKEAIVEKEQQIVKTQKHECHKNSENFESAACSKLLSKDFTAASKEKTQDITSDFIDSFSVVPNTQNTIREKEDDEISLGLSSEDTEEDHSSKNFPPSIHLETDNINKSNTQTSPPELKTTTKEHINSLKNDYVDQDKEISSIKVDFTSTQSVAELSDIVDHDSKILTECDYKDISESNSEIVTAMSSSIDEVPGSDKILDCMENTAEKTMMTPIDENGEINYSDETNIPDGSCKISDDMPGPSHINQKIIESDSDSDNSICEVEAPKKTAIVIELSSGDESDIDSRNSTNKLKRDFAIRKSLKKRSATREDLGDLSCAICLCVFVDRSFLNECFHSFCYLCITQWSELSRLCPLCKTKYSSLIHNVNKDLEYEQVFFEEEGEESSKKKPDVRQPPVFSETMQDGRRFRYRSTVTDHETWAARRVQREQAEQNASRQQRKISRRLKWSATKDRRKAVYRMKMNVKEVKQRGVPKYRNISPQFFDENPALKHRLVPWLLRDLNVLLGNDDDSIRFIMSMILNIISSVSMESEEFVEQLKPFLFNETKHFAEELVSFARSPYDLRGYDANVVYDIPEKKQETTVIDGSPEQTNPTIRDPFRDHLHENVLTHQSSSQSLQPTSSGLLVDNSSHSENDKDTSSANATPSTNENEIAVETPSDSVSNNNEKQIKEKHVANEEHENENPQVSSGSDIDGDDDDDSENDNVIKSKSHKSKKKRKKKKKKKHKKERDEKLSNNESDSDVEEVYEKKERKHKKKKRKKKKSHDKREKSASSDETNSDKDTSKNSKTHKKKKKHSRRDGDITDKENRLSSKDSEKSKSKKKRKSVSDDDVKRSHKKKKKSKKNKRKKEHNDKESNRKTNKKEIDYVNSDSSTDDGEEIARRIAALKDKYQKRSEQDLARAKYIERLSNRKISSHDTRKRRSNSPMHSEKSSKRSKMDGEKREKSKSHKKLTAGSSDDSITDDDEIYKRLEPYFESRKNKKIDLIKDGSTYKTRAEIVRELLHIEKVMTRRRERKEEEKRKATVASDKDTLNKTTQAAADSTVEDPPLKADDDSNGTPGRSYKQLVNELQEIEGKINSCRKFFEE